ncbi:hypothetical protein BGZ95_002344 [Linnemannia exigua]|uniref:VASt domain-containing protein n=1 Tax=Linnemannia exigua TaxID=604196 RepID=A0AAD4H341_9FUNG|nr:hypothetical protein BGZ95_002344 [Linnemannia exigua]
MSTPGRNSSHGSTGKANPFKNLIRRKSLELGRFFDGNAGSSSQASNNGSEASLNQDVSQNTPTALNHEATPDTGRAGAPTPTFPPRPTTRRPAFTLGLPWRPQSEYLSQGSPGVQTSLSKSQKRFIRAFPELADIAKVPAAYCLPCLATPPQTPPPEHPGTPGSTTMSPSNTLSTLTSSAFSTTSSTTTLACPGHFHDYSCALEREILWQGTLYVAATHVCFYGKHFGKTVKVIIDYRDLILIEREKKMGVFPSSIRLRVAIASSSQSGSAPPNSQDTKGTAIGKDSTAVALSGIQTTKDYVLTSLMSREQAFADIEKNWQAHHQFHATTCIGGLLTPQLESPGSSEMNLTGLIDSENGTSTGFGMDGRLRSRGMLNMHKVPRTYSVITDEAFSSSENLNRPHLRERASTSLIRPSTPTSHDTVSSWVAAAALATSGSDLPIQPIGNPIVFSESRRGSVASVGSSDRQEPTSGLIGFLQRRSSLAHKLKRNESEGRGDNLSDSGSDAAQEHGEDVTRLPLDASAVATIVPVQPFITQDPPLLAAQRQDGSLGSSTPPPTLISPSLTTTKVSRSLSTVQTDAKPGSMHGMTKHTRDEKLPSGPVACGCSRHYKNAVVSTVVPLPVSLCFEILFSAADAGLGDKLGCDTHRLKDGSTDILIMPWLHDDDQPQGSNKPDWEDRQRRLEYSVSFKVPMLAKTSTACFEVQKVIQFSPFAILVHSESKTPNVPYGEHFSTVNQICMTWESEGRTRIKCFTEVKFKRSIMWSSKVEAGSLEGSGGFYKEFIRQLEQLVESNRDQLLRSYEARLLATSLISNPPGKGNDPAGCISRSEETRPLISSRHLCGPYSPTIHHAFRIKSGRIVRKCRQGSVISSAE